MPSFLYSAENIQVWRFLEHDMMYRIGTALIDSMNDQFICEMCFLIVPLLALIINKDGL